MRGKPWTEADAAVLTDLHAVRLEQGISLNEAARRMGRGHATLSRKSAELGLSWERPQSARIATEARMADVAATLSRVAAKAAAEAERLIDQMSQPHVYTELGRVAKDLDDWLERTQNEPTPPDKRNLAQSSSTLARTARDILDRDTAREAGSDIDAWLDHMTGGPA